MTRRCYKYFDLRPASLALVETCNQVISQYQSQGLTLTLRQLYYQLVSANDIPNEERSYKRLGSIVSKARLAGLMDWDAIEDRMREAEVPSEFSNLSHLIDAAVASYRLPRMKGQETYLELWVEKDALAGVLSPIADDHHVVLMVNRGYSSQSAMHESARRILSGMQKIGTSQSIILYLGDLDPSGEDMVRDVRDRLEMFGVDGLDVEKLALTPEQVQQYHPPPNPTKLSDSRAEAYIVEHGHNSWEVDALPPHVLTRLIVDAFADILDLAKMEDIKDTEQDHIERLRGVVQELQ